MLVRFKLNNNTCIKIDNVQMHVNIVFVNIAIRISDNSTAEHN